MSRLPILLAFAAVALASCQNATPQPRPFAGRGGRSLDQPPPRYGEQDSRYVEPIAPGAAPLAIDPNTAAQAAAAGIDPRTIPPTANTAPPSNLPATPGVDQGLTVAPQVPGTVPPTTVPGASPTTPTVTPPTTPPPAPGDVPYARSVPGKPGYVYSPKDPSKVISVEGLRPGSKAKDPETGEIFRVPYQ